jgi:hypothetical protein
LSEYQFRREIDAVEKGHIARVSEEGGTYIVVSDTEPDLRYIVEPKDVGGLVQIKCSCASGKQRGYMFIPCWHAALVARRLEREGKARWQHAQWYWTTPKVVDRSRHPEDPLEGLPNL